MVNKDILGGLKSALTRGYSLEEAMLSFFNAGYKRNEIEEAAQSLQMMQTTPKPEFKPQPIFPPTPKPSVPVEIPKPKIPAISVQAPVVSMPVIQKSVPVQIEQPIFEEKPIQVQPKIQRQISRVSAYPSYNARIRTITIVLIILLVVLLGILGLMYLFKNQIIAFFNSIFNA